MTKKENNLDITREQEHAELHRTSWQIANDLRGAVDGWDFKQYVLGMLFYRFISENLTSYINEDERRSGNKEFNYAALSDEEAEFGRADTVKEKGVFILPGELFVNVRAGARNYGNLNETLARIFRNIESSAKGTDTDKAHFAKLVSNKTIEENGYNIAVSTYVAQKDTREVITQRRDQWHRSPSEQTAHGDR